MLLIVSQNARILASDLFTNFFLNAQKETQKEAEAQVEISVYLMDFEKLTVSIKSYDQTEDLLEKVMERLNLNLDYAYYFGIFLVKKDDDEFIKSMLLVLVFFDLIAQAIVSHL